MISQSFYLLLLALFTFANAEVVAQQVSFKILRGHEQIGRITAQKTSVNTKTTYTVHSTASFRVIFDYTRETSLKVVYQGEKLESSDATLSLNKELKEHRITTKQEQGYLCLKNPEEEHFSIKEPILFSSSMLYFKEPKGEKHIFAEGYLEFCPIVQLEPGIYKLTLPEGKINHYVYKDGLLQEIRVFRTMVDLVFKREN